ncbi:laminin subunit alpha-2-like isoform X2 [Amphibalanus amphitrite]|uniref:laminin subunit alpha-2-like isoform X2 n=1 Tax=Amphibalanus amphitrite TaxID=1232801 RepID=UPI001C9067BD|nr:laminin subunit alpha-2-like isoform X2 [Amphibalanus amphitrite]
MWRTRVVLVLCLTLAAPTWTQYLRSPNRDIYQSWLGLKYGCRCNKLGSTDSTCDIITGACTCKPGVVGQQCDRCQEGYFGLESGAGCRPCDCDPEGSSPAVCDPVTGRCRCKPGVGGERCTSCLPGYFQLAAGGCQECLPCSQPGHLCDPVTGQCVCPPNTVGASCERCTLGHWGWNNVNGCQKCDCDRLGSQSSECDVTTGQCRCFDGFGGQRCDRCRAGYFDFPRCQACRCDPDGSECEPDGSCGCDQTGQCRCKKNTLGEKCDRCLEGTFGMSADNPDGCTACFCFTRSGQCSQGEFVWVPLSLPDSRAVTLTDDQTRLNVTNSLRVLPGYSGDVTVGLKYPSDAPIYWQLPPEFLGDKVRSYNGHLRFRSRSFGGSRPFPASILSSYPLVQLQGNTRLVLEHYPPTTSPDGFYQVKLHENFWRVKGDRRALVTREMLMVALQNTQHVLIRATDYIDATRAELSEVSWDIAEPTYGHAGSTALGIERCACPRGYNGSSCQDPSIGFYRSFTPGYSNSEIIIDLVGESVPCQCNGRSQVCDPDTGHCQNCTDNTSGQHCDVCARGYYGNPSEGPCLPCLCPTAQLSNAETCFSNYQGGFRCQCDPGYTGERCDQCAFGYYGSALEPGIGCRACACDPVGSIGNTCDAVTGQCPCRTGVVGRDCTRCAPRHIVTERGCEACQDGCVELLFESLDSLSAMASAVNLTGAGGAPWRRFYQFSNTTETVREEVQQYQESQLTLRAMYETLELDKYATTILIQAEDQLNALSPKMDDVRQFRNEIEEIYQEVKNTQFQAEDTVAKLRNYAIGETSSAGVQDALLEAEALLARMQTVRLEPAMAAAEAELLSAATLLSRLRDMLSSSPGRLNDTRERLERLSERLDEMTRLVADGVRQPIAELERLLPALRERLTELRNDQLAVKDLGNMCDGTLTNTSSLLAETRLLYDAAKGDLVDLRDRQLEVERAEERLRRRTDSFSELSEDYRIRYVLPAQVHAATLTAQAERLEGSFQATRQEADLSLQAAEAYQKIVDALNSARQAAEDASAAGQRAYEQAYPRDTDSLVSLGTQAKTKSEVLFEQAEDLRHQVVVLSGKMAASRAGIDIINGTLRATREQNEEIRTQLALNNVDELANSARAASADAMAVLSAVSKVDERTQRIEDNIDTVLRPGMELVQGGGAESMGNFSTMLSAARLSITEADIRAMEVEDQVDELREMSDNVGLKLRQLKNKILKARQAATNIRVSLTERGAPGGLCSRTYQAPQLQPSTASSVRLNYAISDPKTRDALLLYLPSKTESDFMALEMVNRRIRFLWNNGGQTRMVEHPRRLKTNSEQLMKDQHWYIIDAERIGSLGRLSVRPAAGDRGNLPDTVSNSTSDGLSIMDLTSSDRVYVGLPSDGPDVGTTTRRFAGCLYEATVNGHPLGLWNFAHNEGCGACRAGPSSDGILASSSWYSFSGSGYAELPALNPTGRVQNMLYSVVLNVKTFDEDALLFLAVNEEKDQFFSIELRDGQIVTRVGFNKSDILVVTSNGRYNTGERTTIEATKSGGDVGLKINNGEEFKEGTFHPESSGRSRYRRPRYQLSLDSSRLYFGGVPPDFDRARWPDVTFVPLLGCVEDLQVGQTAQNPLVGNSTGVARECGRQLMKTAGFHGEGYVELNSRRLRKTATLGFTFKTAVPNGLLMLSTFATKEDEKQLPESATDQDRAVRQRRVPAENPLNSEYYMLSLSDGKLELRVNGGGGEAVLTSKRTFHDGRPHTVTVLKQRRQLEMRVSDIVVATGQLPRRSGTVQAPESGGLFLGGVPPELSSALSTPAPPAFDGCISDVIFGDSLMQFDAPLRHKRVTLGRCNGDLFRSRMLHEMASEPEPTSCNKPSQVTLEARAVKLGDDPFSHVFVPVQRKNLRRNFNITLDFRTFYPNGLLLHTESPSRKRSSSLTLRLQDGAVHLTVRRKRRAVQLSAGARLNDGQWQMVTLVKAKRKYTLLVGGASPASRRGPHSIRVGRALYVGGVPPQGIELRGQDSDSRIPGHKKLEMLKTEGFKGCMKQLGINGRVRDLPSGNNIIHRVGQCMARVELGTFFAGDAFAKYADAVKLGDKFDLRLDFRTSRLNGVLVNLLSDNGRAMLSLELRDGDVVFIVDNGAGQPIEARQSFPAKYLACNNRWHTVRATYGKDQAILKVDQYPERYGVSSVSLARPPTAALPLFLGGLPDSARTSLTPPTDNFKGCIRNIDINGARRDWTDMAELSNVLLNSCPVQR